MRRRGDLGFTRVELAYAMSIIGILAVIGIMIYGGYYGKAWDAVTKEDLRQAYSAAMAYFIDFPGSEITLSNLEAYGFRPSPNVKLRIIDGRRSNLLLVAYAGAGGTRGYMTYSPEEGSAVNQSPIWLAPVQGWRSDGAPPTGQPPPLPSSPGVGGPIRAVQADLLQICNMKALGELEKASAVARNYFRENPDGTLTKGILLDRGYAPDENVSLTVNEGAASGFSLSSTFNIPGAASYTADGEGRIDVSIGRP